MAMCLLSASGCFFYSNFSLVTLKQRWIEFASVTYCSIIAVVTFCTYNATSIIIVPCIISWLTTTWCDKIKLYQSLKSCCKSGCQRPWHWQCQLSWQCSGCPGCYFHLLWIRAQFNYIVEISWEIICQVCPCRELTGKVWDTICLTVRVTFTNNAHDLDVSFCKSFPTSACFKPREP